MAKATKKTIEKTVTEDVIVLELTKEEAEAVVKALGMFECDSIQFGILKSLDAPGESDDRPIKVGDRVRVTSAPYDSEYVGEVGNLGEIDLLDAERTYQVYFPGDYVWAKTVERVND